MVNVDEDSTKDTVDDLRQKGNHEFQRGELDNAVMFYTLAIEKAKQQHEGEEQTNAVVVNLCNRSACFFQQERHEEARDDARAAWKLSKEANVKAAYRLSKTYIALNDFSNAIATLERALDKTHNPNLQPKEEKSLTDLLQQAKKKKSEPKPLVETTIKGVDRPISIREFTVNKTLGVGNFSEICIAQHKVTKETFALKKLEKKQAADLAKRQHPNVYNEINMECRVLLKRLPLHPYIVTMYHSFQDYNTLYYLMDLHDVNPDLWSQIKCKTPTNNMVGCHQSQVKRWTMQLISALEHLHSHGIVHRDLKPENILLNSKNHVVVIDFGTAKDLVQTDLNGPEFVGTPDFMAPEAVTGFSGMPNPDKPRPDNEKAATQALDLWALGAVIYILHTGSTPFWSPSPYLAFLRIRRGILTRNWGIPDDDTWDLISKLMQVDPSKRLGQDCYNVENGKVTVSKGYDVIRDHNYFDQVNREDQTHVIPSLQDLCLAAIPELAKKDAVNLDICDQHPPGDGSSHDFTRMNDSQKNRVLHILDKCKVFSNGDETRVFQRFFKTDLDFVKAKVRQESRDFVGLTQMNDDEYKPQSARGSADPYAKKIEPKPTKIVVLTNPLFIAGDAVSEEDEKRYSKGLKACVATINKQRPKAVIVMCAQQDLSKKVWKLLTRIRDSIQVLWGVNKFYSFWVHGFQGLLINNSAELKNDPSCLQNNWIRQEMEQSRMAKCKLFAFCDCDPRDLPPMVLKRLTRGRTLCLIGLSNTADEMLEYAIEYEPNETLDDGASVKSTDSQEDNDDAASMRVVGTSQNGMRWLTVDETENSWDVSFESIPLPE